MLKKRNLTIDKSCSILVTNDGWLVSDMFCNPMLVTRELNRTL